MDELNARAAAGNPPGQSFCNATFVSA